MKQKLFFSAEGQFNNTTTVFAFDSKKARDAYVKKVDSANCLAVLKNKVGIAAANWSMTDNRMIEPKPFTSEYWGIVESLCFEHKKPAGFVGEVMICDEDGAGNGMPVIRRLW